MSRTLTASQSVVFANRSEYTTAGWQTIAFWFRDNDPLVDDVVLTQTGSLSISAKRGFSINLGWYAGDNTKRILFAAVNNIVVGANSAGQVFTGASDKWRHVAFTFNSSGGTATLTIDGAAYATRTTTPFTFAANSLVIGGTGGDVTIANYAWWKRKLGDEEIISASKSAAPRMMQKSLVLDAPLVAAAGDRRLGAAPVVDAGTIAAHCRTTDIFASYFVPRGSHRYSASIADGCTAGHIPQIGGASAIGFLLTEAGARENQSGHGLGSGATSDAAAAKNEIASFVVANALIAEIVAARGEKYGGAEALAAVNDGIFSDETQEGRAAAGGMIDDSATAYQNGQGGAATGGDISIQALSADIQAALSQAVGAISDGIDAGEAWAGSATAAAQVLDVALARDRYQQQTLGPQFDDVEAPASADEAMQGGAVTAADVASGAAANQLQSGQASGAGSLESSADVGQSAAAIASTLAAVIGDAGADDMLAALADVRAGIVGDSGAAMRFSSAASTLADLIAGAESVAIVTAITQARAALSATATAGAIFSGTISYVSEQNYSLLAAVTMYAALNGAPTIFAELEGTLSAKPELDGSITLH